MREIKLSEQLEWMEIIKNGGMITIPGDVTLVIDEPLPPHQIFFSEDMDHEWWGVAGRES
jgi:hypothetical protein